MAGDAFSHPLTIRSATQVDEPFLRNLPIGVILSSTFEVLVEKDQLDEARRVATAVLKQAGRA